MVNAKEAEGLSASAVQVQVTRLEGVTCPEELTFPKVSLSEFSDKWEAFLSAVRQVVRLELKEVLGRGVTPHWMSMKPFCPGYWL